jgi:phosphoesterase RecJ-like protein
MDELRQELRGLAEAEGPIGLLSHVNPDGDGFCACLFMAKWLALHGKEAVIITDGDDLDRFAHLLEDARILSFEDSMSYSTLVVMDCNSMSRLGKRGELVAKADRVLLLDHHEVEQGLIPAHYSFIYPSYVCVGAILFAALEKELNLLPDDSRQYLAACLYTTILNDTNNFTNGNTDAGVLDLAARISAMGIKPHLLYRAYFQNQSYNEMRYTGEVLSTIEVHHGGRVLLLWSDLDMAQRNGIDPGAVLNVTRWVQGVKGIEAIIFIREEEPGFHKLSFRSMKVDVNRFAARYGGGGHRNASGCHLNGELEQIKAMGLEGIGLALRDADGDEPR